MLVAGIAPAASRLRDMLRNEYAVDVATTYEQAMRLVEERAPELLIVGYHFDGMRPYRLIHSVVAEHPHIRILLVRALQLALEHEDDDAVGETYASMGVAEYLVLDSDEPSVVKARLLDAVARVISRPDDAGSMHGHELR